MKKIFILPTLVIIFLFFAAANTYAAYFSYSPSSGSIADGDEVLVQIDTEETDVESATAVVTFDTNKVEITNVAAGAFFDNISVDDNQSGKLVLTATLNQGNQTAVNGSGTIATLTLSPVISDGSFELEFACSSEEIDDSNIKSTANNNLLSSDQQCGENIEGSYTVGSGSSDDDSDDSSPTATTQPALPDELPQSGPEDWLKWITSGLALIGIGLLLF